MKLEQMEEEQESGVQNALIEIGEQMSQKIKEATDRIQVEQVLRKAYEQLDQLKGQANLKRFIKTNLEALASLRKEVILQNLVLTCVDMSALKAKESQ